MKIIATLHRTAESDWKIRINPRKAPTGDYDEEIFSTWKPSNGEEMLIFNPTISLVIKNYVDKSAMSASIPINQTYSLESCLSASYARLQTKGLYTLDNRTLYLDANIAEKCAIRLSVYRAFLTFIPVVVYDRYTKETLKGIRIMYDGKYVVDLSHNELREICEVLNHLDVQAYTMILALAERLNHMDQKLEQILANQSLIISMLKDQGATKVRTSPSVPELQFTKLGP